jgi:hypothetical protein
LYSAAIPGTIELMNEEHASEQLFTTRVINSQMVLGNQEGSVNSLDDFVQPSDESHGPIEASGRDCGTQDNPEKGQVSNDSADSETAGSDLRPVDEADRLVQDVLIETLRLDAQLREVDPDAVQSCAEAMRSGEAFPPIIVFRDVENNLWLADGFQRVAAAIEAELKTLFADIRTGTLDDAKWYSYGANKENNSLLRTHKIKRRAVHAALAHPRATRMSNTEIAKHVGVSEGLVRKVREERAWDQGLSSNDTKIREVTRSGKTYEQDVSRIGKADGPVKPNVEHSVKKLFQIVPKVIEALHDIEESVAGGSPFPMLPENQIEALKGLRDGFMELIRWKIHLPSGIELDELKRAVAARKTPKAQTSLRMPPAAASTGMGSGGAAQRLAGKRTGNSYAKPRRLDSQRA